MSDRARRVLRLGREKRCEAGVRAVRGRGAEELVGDHAQRARHRGPDQDQTDDAGFGGQQAAADARAQEAAKAFGAGHAAASLGADAEAEQESGQAAALLILIFPVHYRFYVRKISFLTHNITLLVSGAAYWFH